MCSHLLLSFITCMNEIPWVNLACLACMYVLLYVCSCLVARMFPKCSDKHTRISRRGQMRDEEQRQVKAEAYKSSGVCSRHPHAKKFSPASFFRSFFFFFFFFGTFPVCHALLVVLGQALLCLLSLITESRAISAEWAVMHP